RRRALLGRFRKWHDHRERAASEVTDPFVVIELVLHALRDFLQQHVADVPAEAVVHVTQAIDVEGDDGRPRGGREALPEQVIETLDEHRALREARERIEIREELKRILLLPVLQGEGYVRRDL